MPLTGSAYQGHWSRLRFSIKEAAAEAIANILRMAVTETEITTSLDNVLFDRRILLEMNEREFAEFSARFAIAFPGRWSPQDTDVGQTKAGRGFFP